jgi:DNA polymerase-1
MTKRTVVCDIEADGLLFNATRIWCIAAKDYNTGETFFFGPDELDDFAVFADTVDRWIGHNFIAYDLRMLKKFLGIKIGALRVTDTLLVSRLQKQGRKGGHSLANWGKILGHGKPEHDDWSQYSDAMRHRCQQDVELNYKVACYLKLEGVQFGSVEASKIEHLSQHILENQREYGFALDVQKAHELFALFNNKSNQLELEILSKFPAIPISKGVVTPRYKKDGTLSIVGLRFLGEDVWPTVSGEFTRIEWQEFNLSSTKQKVSRLSKWWSPTVRTSGYRRLNDKLRGWGDTKKITKEEFDDKQQYMWKLCEENFDTLPAHAPQELRLLGEYAMLTARSKEIEGWFNALGDDDRVHGSVNSIGSITHRMSHNSPNTANIPGNDSPYGNDCRSCYTVDNPDTHVLLGCDASGIQLRILAHYMNDADYTHEVVNGDIHEKNLDAMGIDKGEYDAEHRQHSRRSVAKTFIYAWLLGAGDEKVGLITNGTATDGRRVKQTFLDSLPALANLKQQAAESARTGRLVGLDKRYIEIKSAHFALSCYLQGAESCIMKYAMILWHHWVQQRKLDARQVAVVHDEFQVEVLKEHAIEVGELIKQSIIQAGVHFKLNCPLDAEYTTGNNWAETH